MQTKLTLTRELDHDEAATVLAALRLFQEVLQAEETKPQAYFDGCCVIARPGGGITVKTPLSAMEHFEDAEMLSVAQIDSLCEEINLQPDVPAMMRTVTKRIKAWQKAADGDSNDAEHDAAVELADDVTYLLKALQPQRKLKTYSELQEQDR